MPQDALYDVHVHVLFAEQGSAGAPGVVQPTDRLCSEYPFMPSGQLLTEGRSWLRRAVSFPGQRLTLNQHREILTLAGWIALLTACVEYDSGDRQAAETTCQAALSLGTEADHAEIKAWAHEIRAWIASTTGNYHGVITAARAGIEAAPHHSVAIQLYAQEANHGHASGTAGTPKSRSTRDAGFLKPAT